MPRHRRRKGLENGSTQGRSVLEENEEILSEVIPIPDISTPRTEEDRLGPSQQRTIYQREMDRTEMMRLMRRGYTQQEIASILKISVGCVGRDWQAVRLEMRSRREEDAREKIQMVLDEISEIKREAWMAWEKSKLDHEKRLDEDSQTVKGPTSRSQVVKEGQCGDPRFLQTVLNCLDAERELQGLNPPKTNYIPVPAIPWDALQGLIAPQSSSTNSNPNSLVIEGQVVPVNQGNVLSIEDKIKAMVEKTQAEARVKAQEEVLEGLLEVEQPLPQHDMDDKFPQPE